MKLPLIPPRRHVKDSLVLQKKLLELLGQSHGLPEMGDLFQSHPLLGRQRQNLVNCRHCPLLHPPPRLQRPHVVFRDILVRGPVRKSLPLPDRDPVVLPDLETGREVDQEGEASVFGVGSVGPVLFLAESLDGGDGRGSVRVDDGFDILHSWVIVIVGVGARDETEEVRVCEDDGEFEVFRKAEVSAGDADVLEADPVRGCG